MDITRIKSNDLTIKSTITPETIHLMHYPDGGDQLHIHLQDGISFSRSIFLSADHARDIRDFLNRHYPA